MYAELTSCVSEDGKYVFFPDKFSNVDKGFNIYYREISNQDADAVKIDSGIKFYVVNSSATVVTYLKGEENNLYQYGMSDDSKDKIASGVTNFEVSADGKKIYYLNSESGLYLKSSGEDKEKIASDVSGLVYVSEDFSTVYYVKDESLYKKVVGKEKVKIASDVTYVIKVYDSGELYYAKEVIEEFAYADLIVDDLKDADAAITRPTYPVYPTKPDSPPSWWRFDGTSEEYDELCEEYDRDLDAWQEECDRLDTEYRDAYEKYSLKLNRDYYREQIETETLKRTVYTLCFYDGTKETVVSENTDGGAYYDYTYLGDDDYICADDTPVIIYRKYDWSDFEKLKFSELLEDVSSFETSIGRALSSSVERYIAVKGTPTLVDDEEGTRYFIVNSSGTLVYYLDNVSETENCGDLYGISVKNGVVGKPELYDSDVSQFYFGFVGDSDLKYFKDFDYVQGDLYINKQIIDYDVVCSSMEIGSGINEIYYYTDWDSNKSYGTLKFYNGKKSTKIADDVSMFSLDSDGRVLYLCDYSLTYYKGALYVWENGESRKIDDDVVYAYSAKPSENRKYVTYS